MELCVCLQYSTVQYCAAEGRQRNRFSVTGRNKRVFCPVKLPDCLGTQPVPSLRIGNPLTACRETVTDSNNPRPSSNGLKNATHLLPYMRSGWCADGKHKDSLERYSCTSTSYGGTGRVVVQLHAFLTSVPDWGEWKTSHPGRFFHWQRTPVATEKETGWASEGRSEKRISLVLARFETRIVQPIA